MGGMIDMHEEVKRGDVIRDKTIKSCKMESSGGGGGGGGLEVVIPAVDENSIFWADVDDFPALPDFTCISSSSLKSLPACSTSSSSGSSSWAGVKADVEEAGGEQIAEGTVAEEVAGAMDVLGELGGMAILDDTDMWDPETLFPADDAGEAYGDTGLPVDENCRQALEEEEKPSEDLAMVFFEWLKANRNLISPEDIRSIKLKRSTIESAAKRLGGGREGVKQLLKLILTWVQNYHLQKKQNREELAYNHPNYQHQTQPLAFPSFDPQAGGGGHCFSPPWSGYSNFSDQANQSAFAPVMGGYMGNSGLPVNGGGPFSPEYSMVDLNMGWPWGPFSHYGSIADPTLPACMPFASGGGFAAGQTFPGERFVRLGASATKEARKKRMARQRRLFNHQNHHHNQHRHQNQHTARLSAGGDSNCNSMPQSCPAASNWPVVYPSSSPSPSSSLPQPVTSHDCTASAAATVSHSDSPVAAQQRQAALDRRQGWKPENNKNLKFLLQKVLKQSDVGNLGRIVLPKREAETHLPELDARDGISIQMEDIGTSRVWNMRYRYWPNNKSRMYLLENTGDFVRSNGLQEGDFIVLYSDAKNSKYMIRGVKVRKSELKPDTRNGMKTQKNLNVNSAGGVVTPAS